MKKFVKLVQQFLSELKNEHAMHERQKSELQFFENHNKISSSVFKFDSILNHNCQKARLFFWYFCFVLKRSSF